jgi:hypothetical protein
VTTTRSSFPYTCGTKLESSAPFRLRPVQSTTQTSTGIDELAVSIAAAPEEQAGVVEQLARARAAV